MHTLLEDRHWTTEILRDDSDLLEGHGTIDDRLIGLSLIGKLLVRATSIYEALRRETVYQLGWSFLPRPGGDDLSGCVHMIFRRENGVYRAELELLEQLHNRKVRTEIKVFNGQGQLPITYEERIFEGESCKPRAVRYLHERRESLNTQYFS